MNPFNEIFNNMDTCRHFPVYQLERRADIFFFIYLQEVLAEKFHTEIEGIIPEFSVHIGTIAHSGSNQSFKIDYLAKAKNDNRLFFVKLKTDEGSRRIAQDTYLEQEKKAGMEKLLDGLRKIYKATASKKKYQHLLVALEELGLIKLEARGVYVINHEDYDVDIVYIQPNNPYGLDNVIPF